MGAKIIDVEITPGKVDPAEERKVKDGETVTPKYITVLELTDEDQKRIVDEICQELDAIEKERSSVDAYGGMPFEEYCDMMDAQYEGFIQKNPDQQFTLHKHATKNKCDGVTRSITRAFFDIDPMFSVTPRPGYERQGGKEVTDRQEDFLDQRFDEVIPLEQVFPHTAHNSVLKGVGVLSLFPLIDVEKRQREECYEGKMIPVRDNKGNVIRDPQTGQARMYNQGLKEFLANYPDAIKNPKYHGYLKKLNNGEKIHIVVSYKSIEYNDPWPESVDPKKFWVRKCVEGYRGLCKSRTYGQEKEFTWWELKDEEDRFQFYNLDKLIKDSEDKDNAGKPRPGYESETYNLFQIVHTTKVAAADGEDEERKCIFWIDREKKVMVGSINYPFYGVPSYYLPFNVDNKHKGWYKPGLGKYLTDSNIAQNAFLNFTLEGMYQSNTITPITDDPNVESQFLEKEWTHGVPLKGSPDRVRFLNEFMRPFDVGRTLNLIQYLVQGDEDTTGLPSMLSGKSDPVDPTAPAAKHIAQLEQGNANVSDYIKAMLPSFNQIPTIVLQMYYQMVNESLKYKVDRQDVTGKDNFSEISRDQMIARTNIQSRAMQYSHDKLREKKEDLALYQVARQEPLIARNPNAVYQLMKHLIVGWSPKWKNQVDAILPPLEEFQKEMQTTAVKAVAMYVQGVMQEAKITGQEPQFDPAQLIQAVQQFLADQATPPDEKEMKQRQEASGAPA